MYSKLAKTDIELLRQQGFIPTDDEIIALNDLAIKIENGKKITVINAPRVCTVGSQTFYEPTVGALIWWNEVASSLLTNQALKMYAYFFLLANSRNVEYLNTLNTRDSITKAVKDWKKKLDVTECELWYALLYVKRAYDFDDTQVVNEMVDDEMYMDRLYTNIIACAGSMSVSPKDLYTQTPSQLVELLIQANIHARIPMEQSIAQLYIKYKKMIRQIEDRCNNDKNKEE